MAKTVIINQGFYKSTRIENQTFELARPIESMPAGRIQVKNNGNLPTQAKQVYIDVPNSGSFTVNETPRLPSLGFISNMPQTQSVPVIAESDDEAMNRIAGQFSVLDQMSLAAINGDIRALIVSGPPGVGKSFGVETQMEKASLFDKLAGKRVRFEIVKGAMTPIGLYCQLFKFSDSKNVLVFDDCDSVFQDDLALNILKAALDSGKRRRIFWNSDSAMLRREGVPDQFEFKGSVIFITNLKFQNLKSKKLQDHLEALQSRCHFIDLTIDTERDKMLRISQVHRDADGGLFRDYDFDNGEAEQILEFMKANMTKLRELSLRMALKLADLVKISPENWQALARSTCMNR